MKTHPVNKLGLKSVLKTAFYKSQALVGMNPYLRRPDRRLLEQDILQVFVADKSLQRILFVGCEWYTQHYSRIFAGKDFSTMDIDANLAKYGAAKHIIDGFENVDRHFSPDSLDLIICNGVFGWGLNTHATVSSAFNGSYACLREGGQFLLGWDDMPKSKPFHPNENEAVQRFTPYVFPSLGTTEFVTDTAYKHTYNFYIKKSAAH